MNDKLHIIYGSRSGNSKAVAIYSNEYAKWLGLNSEVISMDNFDFNNFKYFSNVIVIVSTHGEGEPPVPAEEFHTYINAAEVDLSHMNYAVLGLGDSSYRYFCKTGEDFDCQLKNLGANKIQELKKCDIDFEEQSKKWAKLTVDHFAKKLPKLKISESKHFLSELKLEDNQQSNSYGARVLTKNYLNGKSATHPTMNITLSLEGSGIDFHPGDVIGIYASNARFLVDKLLRQLNFDPAYSIKDGDKLTTLKEALIHKYELTVITPILVKNYAQIANNKELKNLIEHTEKLKDYINKRDVLDLITEYPGDYGVEDFLNILRKLSPRLYSAASYLQNKQDKVDLTIRSVDYLFENRKHKGVCSDYVWTRVDIGEGLPIFVESNTRFQLPKEPNQDVIMICTGTGIAPFRSFLQYRNIQKANGRNWLFFGERSSNTDFFYKNEMLEYVNTGLLTKLDTAFSRDDEEKHYIQEQLIENGKEVYNWLENGAKIYLCGNKNIMSNDVRQALIKIVSTYGGINEDLAEQKLKQMRSNKILQEDIY